MKQRIFSLLLAIFLFAAMPGFVLWKWNYVQPAMAESATGKPVPATEPSAATQPSDSAAITPEDVADEEDMQPECADGYLFFYGRQVWMTRDVPAVCGELRKEFSDWLAGRSPLINQGETLARSWNFFIGDKLRNEGAPRR